MYRLLNCSFVCDHAVNACVILRPDNALNVHARFSKIRSSQVISAISCFILSQHQVTLAWLKNFVRQCGRPTRQPARAILFRVANSSTAFPSSSPIDIQTALLRFLLPVAFSWPCSLFNATYQRLKSLRNISSGDKQISDVKQYEVLAKSPKGILPANNFSCYHPIISNFVLL